MSGHRRWRDRHDPQRPQGVRIEHDDGTETLVELADGGINADGVREWRIDPATPFGPRDQLRVDVLPAFTAIVRYAEGQTDAWWNED